MRLGLPIDQGALDRRVTIQYRTDGDSDSGFPTEDWTTTTSVTVFMAAVPLSGMERVAAEQVSARYDTRWVMHYRADMDPYLVDVAKDRRLSYQGRIYNVTGAEMMGNKAAISLTTVAKVG
jgi:SPP1 family predicted phage head-tail adaptor